jgi:hypothetical protein
MIVRSWGSSRSLAAAILSIEANNRVDLTTLTGEAGQHGLQEIPHPAGGVTVLEKDSGVCLLLGGGLVADLSEVGRELLVLGGAFLDIRPGTTSFVNGF